MQAVSILTIFGLVRMGKPYPEKAASLESRSGRKGKASAPSGLRARSERILTVG